MGELEKEFGKRIKQLRRASGSTQDSLARRMDVDTKFVADFESGRRKNPTLYTISRFAKALGVQPHSLLISPRRTDGNAERLVVESLIKKADSRTRAAIVETAKTIYRLGSARKK